MNNELREKNDELVELNKRYSEANEELEKTNVSVELHINNQVVRYESMKKKMLCKVTEEYEVMKSTVNYSYIIFINI